MSSLFSSEPKLDDFAIAHRIDRAHDVGDVGILEAANDVHDRVGLANVGEELVAESFAFGRAFDESRDVDELHDSRHRSLWLDDPRELTEARVRHFHHPDVRLDGAERIIRSFRLRRGEGVE